MKVSEHLTEERRAGAAGMAAHRLAGGHPSSQQRYALSRSLDTSAHQSLEPQCVQVTLRVVGVCLAKNQPAASGTKTLRQCGQT